MEKSILYLENDYTWQEVIEPELLRYGKVSVYNNEHDFRKAIDEIANLRNWPSLIVLEQRVRWTSETQKMPKPPQEVIDQGSINAGIRCYKYLRQAQSDSQLTPVIFYTTSDTENILDILNEKRVKINPLDFQCIEKKSSLRNLHESIEIALHR